MTANLDNSRKLTALALALLMAIVLGCALPGASSNGNKNGKNREADEPKAEATVVGSWKSDHSNMNLKQDGTLTVDGQAYRYVLTDTLIKVTARDGAADFPYKLEEDTLTITYQGKVTVFHRVKSDGGNGGNGAGGGARQELVGKWCYMSNIYANDGGRMSNRCFTLREDGTYEYYSETSSSGENGSTASQESDSGTWTATENSITSNSQSHGTNTYSLEKRNHPKTGDPMLVLNGAAYVTYGQRAPW